MKDAADQNAEALGCRPGAVDAEVPEVPLSVERLGDCLVCGKVGKPKGSVWPATLMPFWSCPMFTTANKFSLLILGAQHMQLWRS